MLDIENILSIKLQKEELIKIKLIKNMKIENNNNNLFELEEYESGLSFSNSKIFNISFNRVAFIFYFF